MLLEKPLPPGSRRRRLWELGSHASCPVVGVCLPMAALRRLVEKTDGPRGATGDYELHCAAVADSKQRTPLAEAMHKELERRYALALQQAQRQKSAQALSEWWREHSAGKDLAGALWATLTHARCTPALEDRVLGEVHMLQHQVGMATRVDLARFEALIDENAVLAREIGAAQQRWQRQSAEHAQQIERLESALAASRADTAARRAELVQIGERLRALEAAAPEIATRFELARENRLQAERLHALQRSLLASQQEAERQRRRADDALAASRPPGPTRDSDRDANVAPPLDLGERAVLCVGGRSASVPAYRRIIERTGGRFLHHDGGEEDNPARLDATLAAADLVICQSGCVSHDAYWRVKDHCKRTGKRCLFVDTPSRTALERALAEARDTLQQPSNAPPSPVQHEPR